MDRAELLDVTRRALKLAQERTTDMADAEMLVPSRDYCDPERFAAEQRLIRSTPQCVGYRSELPVPGSFTTKDVMGVPVLLTRDDDGVVHAFHNICLHRQSPVAEGCGVASRLVCPYHSWAYSSAGELLTVPGRDGFPEMRSEPRTLQELPAAECAGFLWVGLDPSAPLDVPAFLGPLAAELESWGIGDWMPVRDKILDVEIDWKLGVDTFSENYHFATVHQDTFAQIARSNCTAFDSFGPHSRLVFPLKHITDLADVPEDEWVPFNHLVVIYHLHPNIVISVTTANGELFRVYPGQRPGHSVTVHQNASPLDLNDPNLRAGAEAVFDYAHKTVRDEDYLMAEKIQANYASGLREHLHIGRNEPGVQHRHASWSAALAALSS